MSRGNGNVPHYCLGRSCRQALLVPSPLALDVSGLGVRYGDTVAVDGLDLAVPAGQTVALLGPNGAGKSTTVNAVLGLLRPSAGSVKILDRTPGAAVRAGCVGAMLQHGGLPSEARVGEGLRLLGGRVPRGPAPPAPGG